MKSIIFAGRALVFQSFVFRKERKKLKKRNVSLKNEFFAS